MEQICGHGFNQSKVPSFSPHKPYVAVTSDDGYKIDCHLGQAAYLMIFLPGQVRGKLIDVRPMPDKRSDSLTRWSRVGALLKDCSFLLTSGIGTVPRLLLEDGGVFIHVTGAVVDQALGALSMGILPAGLATPSGEMNSLLPNFSEQRID